MSDISLPPGLGVLLIALGLLALTVTAGLAFLITAGLSQKALPFRRRRGFHLFRGMIFPLALALLGVWASEYGPRSLLRAVDESPVVSASVASFVFLWGVLWGARRGCGSNKPNEEPEDDD